MELVKIALDDITDEAVFASLERIRITSTPRSNATTRTIAEQRGYSKAELFAIAETAHHYLRSGGTRLARVLFEGLASIDPREPYFALALGFACDRLGDQRAAIAHYSRATRLAPNDARAEINIAELMLELGDRNRARVHLARAATKAHAAEDETLAHKAQAMLSLMKGT